MGWWGLCTLRYGCAGVNLRPAICLGRPPASGGVGGNQRELQVGCKLMSVAALPDRPALLCPAWPYRLQDQLYKEMRGRIQEADQSAPVRYEGRGGAGHAPAFPLPTLN